MSIYSASGRCSVGLPKDWMLERMDPSRNGEKAASLAHSFVVSYDDLTALFFGMYGIEYIVQYCAEQESPLRVITHPYETNTCFEKAELLGAWDPLNVIKALYFERSDNARLYAVVIPETGCFVDKGRLKELLAMSSESFLRKSDALPRWMSFGTCSPFVRGGDFFVNGGCVDKIIFDAETVEEKGGEGCLDDFSFGLDHKVSLQMNYSSCYDMLKRLYPAMVVKEELLNLAFKEKLVRSNGKINISYQFDSLNYRTAKFMNGIHGYGDVTKVNDYSDELNLPRILSLGN